MDKVSDASYLAREQYKDLRNLKVRWKLYDYVVPKSDIYQKGFENLNLSSLEDVLEVGCGSGENVVRLRKKGHKGRVGGLDINPLLFKEASEKVFAQPIEWYVGSADDLPFEDKSLDCVIAHFMIYHLPDIQKGLKEWKRVLRNGGRVLVSTASKDNFPKYVKFKERISQYLSCRSSPQFSASFNLENGGAQLREVFLSVERYVFEGELQLRTVQPYLDFLISIRDFFEPVPVESEWKKAISLVEDEINEEIRVNGVYRDSVKRGFFIATKKKC